MTQKDYILVAGILVRIWHKTSVDHVTWQEIIDQFVTDLANDREQFKPEKFRDYINDRVGSKA